jgi:hypothetical protein
MGIKIMRIFFLATVKFSSSNNKTWTLVCEYISHEFGTSKTTFANGDIISDGVDE